MDENTVGERRVRKIKRNAKGFVTVMYEAQNGSGHDRYTMQCKTEPHPDLLVAFRALLPHVEAICELPPEYMEHMIVSGVSFTYKEMDSGDICGAVITSQKTLDSHPAPLILNTPHKTDVPYTEEGDTSACFSTAAVVALDIVKKEALAFVDGKRGVETPIEETLAETGEPDDT